MVHRRTFGLGLIALGLSACGGTPARFNASSTAREAAFPALPNPAFDAWVAGFKTRAAGQGISQSTLNTAFARVGFLPGVIERDRNQTEFKRSLEDYLSIAASDERVSKGRAAYARHRAVLGEIEQRFGVEGHVVAAVWGLESFYGERRGSVPVISASLDAGL